MTVKEYAQKHGISERYVLKLIDEGKISGASKIGKSWFIKEENDLLLPPVSNSHFPSVIANNYYVDKTLLIKDIILSGPIVTLFTRPRRFGKTLNMSMIKTFFERSPSSKRRLFASTNIFADKYCMSEQGRYPVISLSFKQLRFATFEENVKKLKQLVQDEIDRLDPMYHLKENDYFNKDFDEVDLSSFLEQASLYLAKKTGTETVIIIDEYDVPITQGYLHGFYDRIIALIRNFFSGGFKDNPHLKYGFLTGVYHVAKESVFSGMNNLYVDSLVSGRYAKYFGYTDEEVLAMLSYYGNIGRYGEVKARYDGYQMGGTSIYNPWSVNNYIYNGFALDSYWGRTGSNDIIKEIIDVQNEAIISSLERLYKGESLNLVINEGIIYPELRNHPTNVFSFLLYSGYLTAIKKDGFCTVFIPNGEIKQIFKEEILEGLDAVMNSNSLFLLQNALLAKDGEAFKSMLNNFLLRSVSFFDGGNEAFYHGLTLGLLLLLDGVYEIRCSREAGYGKYDICLSSKSPLYSSIIIELKHSDQEEDLESDARKALAQIHEKQYYADFLRSGRKPYLIGLSYCGKKAFLVDEI